MSSIDRISGNLLVFKVFHGYRYCSLSRCNSDKVYRHGRSCSQHERFVVVHVNVFSSSLTLMKPENRL